MNAISWNIIQLSFKNTAIILRTGGKKNVTYTNSLVNADSFLCKFHYNEFSEGRHSSLNTYYEAKISSLNNTQFASCFNNRFHLTLITRNFVNTIFFPRTKSSVNQGVGVISSRCSQLNFDFKMFIVPLWLFTFLDLCDVPCPFPGIWVELLNSNWIYEASLHHTSTFLGRFFRKADTSI